jgi:hypothetical protein
MIVLNHINSDPSLRVTNGFGKALRLVQKSAEDSLKKQNARKNKSDAHKKAPERIALRRISRG